MSAARAQISPAKSSPASGVTAAVEAVLSLPDAKLDYVRAKIALDAVVDPSVDATRVLAELDRLARFARRIADGGPPLAQIDAAKEHLMERRRHRESLALAELIARHHPSDGFAWAHQG